MAGPQSGPCGYRTASHRSATDQQNSKRRRTFRCYTNPRSLQTGAIPRERDGEGRSAPSLLYSNQYGGRTAKSWHFPERSGCFRKGVSRRLSAGYRGADVYSAAKRREASPHFALLADIAARNGLTGLSMGMSADYPLAIEFGATIVRVGSAILWTADADGLTITTDV